jgi:DNA invertase Pin-like site-specific DNA recombinase
VAEYAALWKRASDDSQETANQDAELAAHVAARGYEVKRTFDLPDLSASQSKKRHIQALEDVIADMHDGLYKVLVVVHSSRLDRRDEDEQLSLLLRIRQAGGRVESVREPNFGSTDMAGRLVTTLAQVMNAEYSRALGGHVRAGNARLDAQGVFRGGKPPIGYRVSGTRRAKKIEQHPDTAPIVREIFSRAADGQPVTRIQAWLADLGYRKTISAITGTLRREVYWTGRYQVRDHAGVVQIHRCEPIVTKALFDAANADLDSRYHVVKKPRQPRRPDFSGAVRCGQCLGPAYRNWSSSKKRDEHGKRLRTRVYYCRECRLYWDADTADTKLEEMMSGDTWPEVEIRVIPGADWTDEIERVEDELLNLAARGLPYEEEDEERVRLRRELKRLKALPVVAPTRKLVMTGRTRGATWDAMSHAERVTFIRDDGIRIELHERGTDVDVRKVDLNEEPEGEDVFERDEHGNDHYVGTIYPDSEHGDEVQQ